MELKMIDYEIQAGFFNTIHTLGLGHVWDRDFGNHKKYIKMILEEFAPHE